MYDRDDYCCACGQALKGRWHTQLEGDGFGFITAYDTLVVMGEHLKGSMSSLELMSELLQVVEVIGGADDASLYRGSRRDRVASVAEILLSLSTMSRPSYGKITISEIRMKTFLSRSSFLL